MTTGRGRAAGAAALLALAASAAFALGMDRGVVLSGSIKTKVWPWAPFERPRPLEAQALSDPVWQFVPWLDFARREIAAGRLPLWNPHQDGGVPLLGNAISALGSPLVWPALLLGVAHGWNASLLLRLLVAAFSAWAWHRERGRSPAAAALGAVAFALSGPFIAWLEHPHTLALAPVPLLLLFIRRLATRPARRDLLGLAGATYLVLAGGHPETAAMAALLAAAYLAVVAPAARAATTPLFGALAGAGLAAPLLLPFTEYFFLSEAAQGIGRHASVLPVASVVRFLFPDAASFHPIETAASASLAVLLLGGAAFFLPRGHRLARREAAFALLGVALCLAVAYDNPLARALAEATPVYWSRALLFAPLLLGALAADGLDVLLARAGAAGRLAAGRLVAACLVLAAAAELLLAARGVHGVTPRGDLARTTPLLERLRAEPGVFRVLPLHTFLPANAATALGLDDLRGYDALSPAGWRTRRAEIGSFENAPTVIDTLLPWRLAQGGNGLDFWNVRFLLLHPQFRFPVSEINGALGTELVETHSGPDGRILENRRVLPRVRLEGGRGEARIASRTPTRWRIEVDARAPSRLVVANPFFPGWRVRVDGSAVPLSIRPGDPIAFEVPAGRHAVELRYAPASFAFGLALAAASLAALLLGGRRFGEAPRSP